MPFDPKQKGVLRGMIAAVAVTVVALPGAVVLHPAPLMPPGPLSDRIAATLGWDVLVLLCLIGAVGNLARHRFLTPADIDGSGMTTATDRARIYQSIVQNTLEQSVIAVLAHLAWTVTLPLDWQAAVPVAAMLFVVGRVFFAAGYKGGAPARAFGFALTFYPSVLMAIAVVVWLIITRV